MSRKDIDRDGCNNLLRTLLLLCGLFSGGWDKAKDGPHAWGLCYNQELAPEKDYCKAEDLLYPCAPGAGYYGRGAFPLYWYVRTGLLYTLLINHMEPRMFL